MFNYFRSTPALPKLYLALYLVALIIISAPISAATQDSLIHLDVVQNAEFNLEVGEHLGLSIRFSDVAKDSILFDDFQLSFSTVIVDHMLASDKQIYLPSKSSLIHLPLVARAKQAGTYSGMLRFHSEYDRVFDYPIALKIKEASSWAYIMLLIGLGIGVVLKLAAGEEKWMILEASLKELIDQIPTKELVLLKKANRLLEEIYSRKFNHDHLYGLYVSLKEEVEKIHIKTDELKINSLRYLLIYVAHVLISTIASLYVFHQLYCKNDTFGANGYMDYLTVLTAAITISYTSDKLLSDRVTDIIKPIAKK